MIKIGSFRFRLQEVNGLQDGDQKLDGDIKYDNQVIRLEKQNSQILKDLTIIHEAVHGMLTLGVSRDLGNDEALVSLIAYNLYNFLRDNSKLVKDIVDRK